MGLFLSTTGTDVTIQELGYTIVHPTTDYEISAQFSSDEISQADSLTSAIQAGTLVWKKSAGGATEPAADYDPDYLEVEEHASGGDDLKSQVVKRRGFKTSVKQHVSANGFVYNIMPDDFRIHHFTGGGPFVTGPIFKMPNATLLEKGHEYSIINDSLAPAQVQDFNGNPLDVLIQTKRIFVYLIDNSTPEGLWAIGALVGSSAVQGVSPVLCYYGANANANRYLEIFPSIPSDEGPFVLPENSIIIAVVFQCNAVVANGQIGIYEVDDLNNPRYTVQITNTNEAIFLNLNVVFLEGEAFAVKVQPGSDSIQKPRLAVYVAGA